jgi:hypothetical protein
MVHSLSETIRSHCSGMLDQPVSSPLQEGWDGVGGHGVGNPEGWWKTILFLRDYV